MDMIDENLIRITAVQSVGPLPDPFRMDDGQIASTPALWEQRRRELYRAAVELQFGTQPPEPEFLTAEPLDNGTRVQSIRITTGPRNHPVTFLMRVFYPAEPGKHPVVVDGDLCWAYHFDKAFLSALTDQNIIFVTFNREELAPDRFESGRSGPLYQAYPDRTFGAVGAWAWGFSRCVDALEQLGIGDRSLIAFCGHSRGGKAALLAGALDTRAAIVNPNCAGGGGSGCYRIHMTGITEDGREMRDETLKDLMRPETGFWFGPELGKYAGQEETLPFDEHFLKALVAPRILLETQAASDLWANSVGTWQTAEAVREVYRFLGAPENMLLYYRRGVHSHDVADVARLARIINQKKQGLPFEEGSFRLPFRKTDLFFNWKRPNLR